MMMNTAKNNSLHLTLLESIHVPWGRRTMVALMGVEDSLGASSRPKPFPLSALLLPSPQGNTCGCCSHLIEESEALRGPVTGLRLAELGLDPGLPASGTPTWLDDEMTHGLSMSATKMGIIAISQRPQGSSSPTSCLNKAVSKSSGTGWLSREALAEWPAGLSASEREDRGLGSSRPCQQPCHAKHISRTGIWSFLVEAMLSSRRVLSFLGLNLFLSCSSSRGPLLRAAPGCGALAIGAGLSPEH